MNKKTIILGGISSFLFIAIVMMIAGGIGKCDDQEYQIIQTVTGNVSIRDTPGFYLKNFASVWSYPRAIQKFWSEHTDEGGSENQSIKVTFNDGGEAYISAMIQYQTPITEDLRRKGHQNFSGSVENMTRAVRAHLVNCLKNSAPIMSASEHQSARKAEYRQVVENQLAHGLYAMKKVERELKDQFNEKGNPITVWATEIVDGDDGNPTIAQESPLQKYGLNVLQFSITSTKYDEKTLEQFGAKKEFFLKAEQAKAARQQEVQERLMVQEKGLREKAEVEADANKEKAKQETEADMRFQVAETEAQMKVAVAIQEKLEKEAIAAAQVAIAEQEKIVDETNASAKVRVAELAVEEAKLNALAANENAKAIKTLASAEEEKIAKAGAITEKEKVLAEIKMQRDGLVAQYLAQIKVPSVIMTGDKEGSNMSDKLINLRLLEATGILPTTNPSNN